ncbi:hypothetical protein GCM10007159_03190 [Modicisalibacter luteus]|nr:hypothetical protein GCM10007159_03190 [Halomonas lutea]
MTNTKLKTTSLKLKSPSLEQLSSTSFNNEVLDFWAERARMQLTAMRAISDYLG